MQVCISSPGSVQHASVLCQADCLDALRELPDNSVDLILTDPPYGINYQSRSTSMPRTTITNDGPEAFGLLDKALALAKDKLKWDSHIYVFSDFHVFEPMAAVVKKYFNLKNVLIWVKNNQTRGDLKGNYGYQYEMILYAHKGRKHLSGRRDGNVLYYDKVYSNRMRHPTEKPVPLLEYLIGKSTVEGDTVLDMFMGSGSTIEAAERLKRHGVGIEIDPTWFPIAKERLAELIA